MPAFTFMRKLSLFTLPIFLAILTLSGKTVSAAPAPWGIAIKESEEKCAGYWGGDERVAYGLPSGWTAYYPETIGDNAGMVDTPLGSCNFYDGEKACCEELGLVYISDNIGLTGETIIEDQDKEDTKLGGLIDPNIPLIFGLVCCCSVTLILVGGGTFIFMLKRDKGKSTKD